MQAGGSPGGGGTVGEGDQTALLVGLLRQSLQQNQQMMQQNQQLVATMLRRMDLEEERRNKAEEKVAETAEAAKKAAEAALTRDPFDPRAAASSVDPGDKVPGSGFGGSNRAEKYLPPLPLIDHHVMGKGRMKEVEGWHTFLETLSSWLALQEEAFVRELQLCVPVKTEILQTKLPSDTAARSSKLFYYLTQSLAKWERGLELLRSCSKRQGMSACGYEVVRTITSQYSIVSRMEAVYVRDSALKLFQSVGGIKRPTDLIRHLEDAFAKSESKLTNSLDLSSPRLTAARCYCKASVRKFASTWFSTEKVTTGRLFGRVSRTTRSSFDSATSLGPLEPSVTSSVTTVGRRDTRRSSAGRRNATRELRPEVLERARATKRRKEKDVATRRQKVLAHPVALRRAKATKEKATRAKRRARTSGRKGQRDPRSTRKVKTRDAP